MSKMKMNTAIRLDLFLLCFWIIAGGCCYAFFPEISKNIYFALTYIVLAIISILITHFHITYHITKPIKKFLSIADNVIESSTADGVEDLEMIGLEEVEGSFKNIVVSMINTHVQIADYVKQISDMNHDLETKIESLSTLYYASQSMGGSLSVDTLARNFLNIFIERLDISGACLMLYNEKNDIVTVKDLVGMPTVLFAKLKFDSSNLIVTNAFSSDICWQPTEQDHNLMVADLETDEVRRIKLVIPMRIKDHFVGLLLLSNKADNKQFEQNEFDMYQAIVTVASTSINNAILFENSEATKNELDKKVFNLMTLQQSSRMLSSTLNLEELITMSIDMFIETVWASSGILMLRADDKPELEIKAFKGITQEEIDKLAKNPAESWAMTTIEKERKPILAQNITGNTFQSYLAFNRDLPFAAYIPMLKEDKLYGVVKIGAKINGQPFTEDDLEFFSTIASQAVIAFENARLYSLAITDSITRLYLNRYFHLRLDEEVSRSKRYNSTLSLLMLDIDHFKNVNDTYGHQQGDAVLKGVSRIIRKNVRNTDIPARYGGEEFAIILPETTIADAKIVADRIRSDIAKYDFQSISYNQPPIKCTISIGIASFPLNAESKESLIRKADNSLYKAKNGGRNQVVLCDIE